MMSFFSQVCHPDDLAHFRNALNLLTGPHQHIILCFCASQIRWTFFSPPRRSCPLCSLSWTWEHFFSCPHVSNVVQSRGLSLSECRNRVRSLQWDQIFTDIGHVVLVWSFILNRYPDLALNYDVDVFRSLVTRC